MNGPNLRILCKGNLPGILENLARLYSTANFEVREFILRIRYLALASMKAADPHGMRSPLFTIMNTVAVHSRMLIMDPVKFEVLIVARAFAVGAMQIVELLERAPQQAVAAPPEPACAVVNALVRFPHPRHVQPQQQRLKKAVVPVLKAVQPKKAPALTAKTPVKAKQNNSPKPPLPPRPPPSSVVEKKSVVDKKPGVKVEKFERKECEHCDKLVPVDHCEQLKHAWKKHKEQVYRLSRPELVCSLEYCDYVGSSKTSKRIHEGRSHGENPPPQKDVIAELKSGKCIYCHKKINTLVYLKHHLVNECKKRDQRPMLGCSACPKTFHFIYDFVTHLRINGGIGHGFPVHNISK